MFNISLSELGVAGVIAILILGPKEFKNVIRYLKYFIAKLKNYVSHYISPIDHELESFKKHIIDLDGKEQETYDISDIIKKVPHEKRIRKVNKEKL